MKRRDLEAGTFRNPKMQCHICKAHPSPPFGHVIHLASLTSFRGGKFSCRRPQCPGDRQETPSSRVAAQKQGSVKQSAFLSTHKMRTSYPARHHWGVG